MIARVSSLGMAGLLAAAWATPAVAQTLADRIAAIGDGAAIFEFAARPEVCGDGDRSIQIGRSFMGEYDGVRHACVPGPVQVRITLHGGIVEGVESWVGTPRPREGRELGVVRAAEAAHYLLNTARTTSGKAAARAVTPAVFADSAVVWPALVSIARDPAAVRKGARQEALLWLSSFAAAAMAGHPTVLGDMDERDGDDVKLQAVFVLSQLPNKEGIEPLLNVARSGASLAVRQRALFWLGQSGDPRAVELFESLLRESQPSRVREG